MRALRNFAFAIVVLTAMRALPTPQPVIAAADDCNVGYFTCHTTGGLFATQNACVGFEGCAQPCPQEINNCGHVCARARCGIGSGPLPTPVCLNMGCSPPILPRFLQITCSCSCMPEGWIGCTYDRECCNNSCNQGICGERLGCDQALCALQGGICTDGLCFYSPVLIPTGTSQAYRLTSASEGVLFDSNANGTLNRVGWTEPDDELAFLAMDRNGDGQITNGHELFGNVTVPGVSNGFAALAVLTNHQGAESISANEPEFASLLLWTDRNHNGVSEPDELQPASNVIRSIGLIPVEANRRDGDGNRFKYRGWAELAPRGAGRGPEHRIFIYDVFLNVAQ